MGARVYLTAALLSLAAGGCAEGKLFFDAGGGSDATGPDQRPGDDGGDVGVVVCGDGDCAASESCTSCPSDCGACPPVCDEDGVCDPGEDLSCADCAASCSGQQKECDGADAIKECVSGSWQSTPCAQVCSVGYSAGCTTALGTAACDCRPYQGFGDLCDAVKRCGPAYKCLKTSTSVSGFCSKACPALGASCTDPPPGAVAGCVTNVGGIYYCIIFCGVQGQQYSCPTGLLCSGADVPAGSGQYPCLPP